MKDWYQQYCGRIVNSMIVYLKLRRFWWGNLRERDHLGDTGVGGRIILRCFFRKQDVGVWTGSSWLRIGTGGGHL